MAEELHANGLVEEEGLLSTERRLDGNGESLGVLKMNPFMVGGETIDKPGSGNDPRWEFQRTNDQAEKQIKNETEDEPVEKRLAKMALDQNHRNFSEEDKRNEEEPLDSGVESHDRRPSETQNSPQFNHKNASASKRESADTDLPLVSPYHIPTANGKEESPGSQPGNDSRKPNSPGAPFSGEISRQKSPNPEAYQKHEGSSKRGPKKGISDRPGEVDIFAHIGDEDEDAKNAKSIYNLILENIFFTILIANITIYSLFSDDVKILFTQKSADIVFDILNIIAIVLFSSEILLSFIGKPTYRWSFFFYLDIISTVSMLLDLTWISNSFNGGYSISIHYFGSKHKLRESLDA